MTEQIKAVKERLVEETRNNKNVPFYSGVKINQENFNFDDVVRMLVTQNEGHKRQIEDWKFSVELYRTK